MYSSNTHIHTHIHMRNAHIRRRIVRGAYEYTHNTCTKLWEHDKTVRFPFTFCTTISDVKYYTNKIKIIEIIYVRIGYKYC